MMSFFCFIFVTVTYGFMVASGDQSALCETWTLIEHRLKDENFHISCLVTDSCYGLNCSGTSHGYDVRSRIVLNSCENPPSVEFQINIPKLNINNIKRKFSHNDSIEITKNLHIEVEIGRNKQNLVFSLFVHMLNNGSFPLLRVPMRIPVISNMALPIHCEISQETRPSFEVSKSISKVSPPPTKSFLTLTKGADDYSNCSIRNSTCSEEEICQQIDKTKPDGICVCISNYTRDDAGKCVHNKTLDPSSVSLLLTAILVPIFVVLIIVASVYIVIRFRVFQHLRRRLRVQVYEHVLLGEEEEEDTTNPVA